MSAKASYSLNQHAGELFSISKKQKERGKTILTIGTVAPSPRRLLSARRARKDWRVFCAPRGCCCSSSSLFSSSSSSFLRSTMMMSRRRMMTVPRREKSFFHQHLLCVVVEQKKTREKNKKELTDEKAPTERSPRC